MPHVLLSNYWCRLLRVFSGFCHVPKFYEVRMHSFISFDWDPLSIYYHPYKVQTYGQNKIPWTLWFPCSAFRPCSFSSCPVSFTLPNHCTEMLIIKLATPLFLPCGIAYILPSVLNNFCLFICLFSSILVAERAFTSKTFSSSSKIWFISTSFLPEQHLVHS